MKKHLIEQNRLWDYQVIRELGRGEYGTVFQVKSKKDGKVYALKKINIAGRHEKQKIQAFREIKALKLLHHPDIIEYYESFLSMDSIYIVTQFAEKGDLSVEVKKRLKLEKKYTEEELWAIATELIMGLKHLHEKNIIHRDFKLQNIFQTKEGKIKIGDLGMSKIIYGAEDLLSTRVGTPVYFAPEVIQNRLYSFPVDIWALGCVLYSIAALQHPFKDATIETLAYYIIDRDPKPIKGQYSAQLISFIMGMLDKNPQTRPTIHQIHKKLKERKDIKINNKVSVFNLRQILTLKSQHFQQSSENSPNKNRHKLKRQNFVEIVPSTLILSKNRQQENPRNSADQQQNPQKLSSERRNLSMLLPNRAVRSPTKQKIPSDEPMIKSNGFSFHLPQGNIKKSLKNSNQMSRTARYGRKSFNFGQKMGSLLPSHEEDSFRQNYPRRARARVQLF